MFRPQDISIPIFALFIAIEAWLIFRGNREDYDKKDTWTNIALGFGSAGFGLIFGLFNGLMYVWIYETTPFKMPLNAWWAWVVLFVADDFLYYWFHRISHESRFFWNFHVVHHSSNRYNLSVAVRQSWFSGIAHWVFYLPLALIGFPLWAYVLMHGFNLLYQFWIHTELIGKLPKFIEYIFNTPSHHRVHHGVNQQYQDKNYSGVLMIWDRMFGTFEPEIEKVRYGITTPLNSYNWLWINSHAWAEMWSEMQNRKTILEKMRCIFGSPNMNAKKLPAHPGIVSDFSAGNG